MSTDEAALVMVFPDDDIHAVITKVQSAGAPVVELLVPEGVHTLHTLENCELLRQATTDAQTRLLVISSDDATLDTLARCDIETVGTKNGAHLLLPTPPPPADSAPASQPEGPREEPPTTARAPMSESDLEFLRKLTAMPLPEAGAAPSGREVPAPAEPTDSPSAKTEPATVPGPVEPATAPGPVEPAMSAEDEDFLAALDDLSDMYSGEPQAAQTAAPATAAPQASTDQRPADYDAFAAELDDLSASLAPPAAAPQASTDQRPADYDAFAAELDDWSTSTAPEPARPTASAASRTPPPAPRRIRPEDIELSPEEKKRASSVREVSPRRTPKPARSAAGELDRLRAAEVGGEDQPRRKGVPFWLILLLIAVVAALIGFLLSQQSVSAALPAWVPFLGHATVLVTLAEPPAAPQPFSALPVPRTQPGQPSTDMAITVEEIRATVRYTQTGQVISETLTPAGLAQGSVVLLNNNAQAIDLPQGTEFIGTNQAGNEVVFTSDIAITVPPATTSDTGAQIITTRGQVEVPITARVPGSGSNIAANTISQIIPPGQAPIFAVNGSILWNHAPIDGGSEQAIRVVKDYDVYRILGSALEGLNNRARQVLEAQLAHQGGLVLEVTTIMPNAADFRRGEEYTQTVLPPVQSVLDPADPGFAVVVTAEFSALATPPDRPLQRQLQEVVPLLLQREVGLPRGMEPAITTWYWNGSLLAVDGSLEPASAPFPLEPAQRLELAATLAGKTRADATAILEDFVARRLIGDYMLPEQHEQLPNRVDVQIVPELVPAGQQP